MPISSPRLASPIKLGRRALSCLKRAPNRTRWAGPGRGASPNRSRRGSCGGRRRTCARDSYKTPSPAPRGILHMGIISRTAGSSRPRTRGPGSRVHGLGGGRCTARRPGYSLPSRLPPAPRRWRPPARRPAVESSAGRGAPCGLEPRGRRPDQAIARLHRGEAAVVGGVDQRRAGGGAEQELGGTLEGVGLSRAQFRAVEDHLVRTLTQIHDQWHEVQSGEALVPCRRVV